MPIETFDPKFTLESKHAQLIKSNSPIGIDLDGTKVSLAPVAISGFNFHALGKTTKTYGLEDMTDPWKMAEWYAEVYSCSREEALSKTSVFWNSAKAIQSAEPIPGALEVVDFLEKYDINHYFITSRPFSTFESTKYWFEKNRNGKGFDRLLMQTSEEYGRKYKVDLIKEKGVKVHFEDMPEHAFDVVNNTSALVVMVTHPWNRNIPEHPRIIKPQGRENEGNLLASFKTLLNHLQRVAQ